jgi:hypothetical protein
MAALDKKPRLKLPVQQRPHYHDIRKGLALGYRKNKGGGTWLVRVADGKGKNWLENFAISDDNEKADGVTIMNYEQALAKAPSIAGVDEGVALDKPISVERAIDTYESDLIARGKSRYNATMVRKYDGGMSFMPHHDGDVGNMSFGLQY